MVSVINNGNRISSRDTRHALSIMPVVMPVTRQLPSIVFLLALLTSTTEPIEGSSHVVGFKSAVDEINIGDVPLLSADDVPSSFIHRCQYYFGCEMPSRSIKNNFDKFILRYNCVENVFCEYNCVIT